MRILLSDKTAAGARSLIEHLLKSHPFEILTPPDALSRDFDVAFVSRDVEKMGLKEAPWRSHQLHHRGAHARRCREEG